MNTPFDPDPISPQKRGLISRARGNFLTGLVVIAPVGLTIWLIWSVVGWIDGFVLPLVPLKYHPDRLIQDLLGLDPLVQINVRGIGVVIFLLFTVLVGWIAKGLIGRSAIHFAEGLVERTPVVRSIYSGIKQISETIFAQNDRSFETACLIEYPRKGIWAIGFISTGAKAEIAEKSDPSDEMLSVFLPTTPNPTSGFLLFLPRRDVIELDMSVEDSAKLVISAGLVYPNPKAQENGDEPIADLNARR
ncbi:DUF502 domain-containing protein [Sulfitobacter donghicola]|uniref:Membrane protein n=1 Tax=Sulfitobacter donghicola DSW-25 = KCTC 12864 = JCM 14565 TaxID=1300350 RepID=A0A073ISR4_9RHOB|nr:DUF502 domain-containing protein [Sulfitobacter donghicola]KEJ88437.1 membrane protein [Sulfitobacter donghicola DSW-25 = KCTC 12864 = JCM 14565]KIN69694.1 Membrane protein [Sulfitobacter donghicola DSW-25 = KCTC 12864 = JCM 14565]